MDYFKGKTVLITGASMGMGATFAAVLAAEGADLVLVARSEEKLRALAQKLAEQHHIRAEIIVADLGHVGAARIVFEETQRLGLTVDILINNAGFGTFGLFETIDAQREQQEIQLNISALVDMTHFFLPSMVARHQGGIINIGSTASFQPTPYMAVYGATKAFVLSFSEALWGEYHTKGVRVLALCPGATSTEFFNVVGTTDAAVGKMVVPEQVVRLGLRAFVQGRPSIVSGGWMNTFFSNLPRFFPRRMTANTMVRIMGGPRQAPQAPMA